MGVASTIEPPLDDSVMVAFALRDVVAVGVVASGPVGPLAIAVVALVSSGSVNVVEVVVSVIVLVAVAFAAVVVVFVSVEDVVSVEVLVSVGCAEAPCQRRNRESATHDRAMSRVVRHGVEPMGCKTQPVPANQKVGSITTIQSATTERCFAPSVIVMVGRWNAPIFDSRGSEGGRRRSFFNVMLIARRRSCASIWKKQPRRNTRIYGFLRIPSLPPGSKNHLVSLGTQKEGTAEGWNTARDNRRMTYVVKRRFQTHKRGEN